MVVTFYIKSRGTKQKILFEYQTARKSLRLRLLVLLAICIGFSIALWATNSWLASLAYKAHICW